MTTQVQISLSHLKANTFLFKIFGHEEFSFQQAFSQSKVDWSGFYTQLNPQHSMRYLTKKWDDGANEACLILLTPRQNFKLIKLHDKIFFSNPKVSGEQKSLRVKQSLRKKSSESKNFQDLYMKNEDILIKTLGERQTLLECVDMEQNEIIISHDLLNEKYFSFQSLLKFKKSNDGLLRTIGWKWGYQSEQNFTWTYIKGQAQYEPYLILKQQEPINSYLNQIKHSS